MTRFGLGVRRIVFVLVCGVLLASAMPAWAADGDYVWAKQLGGSGLEIGQSVAVDSGGNVYTTGYFQGTVDFDPGAGTANLTAGGQDIFVSKLDSNGAFVWAKQITTNTFLGAGYSIAVDSSSNAYITGLFSGTADFDPGAGTYNLTAVGINDIFVCKLNSSGTFVWARQMGGSGNEAGQSVAVDSSGNVYTTGFFFGTADFDPGAGTYNLTAVGSFDMFISKLNSSGAIVWAKQTGGSNGELGLSVALDLSGNVYTTGFFSGTADFDPGAGMYNLSAVGTQDIFVSKLDSSGAFLWAKQMIGDGEEYARSIAVDGNGNVYTTGEFFGTVDFDPGAGTTNLTGGNGWIFVSKLDNSGAFVWVKQMGGVSGSLSTSVAVDGSGNVYTTGSFWGTADFDPGPGTVNLTSVNGNENIFVSKLDSSGAFIWAKPLSGGISSYGRANSVTVDGNGNVYTTGSFSGTVDFDPGAGTANLTAVGSNDIFVSKLSGPPPGPPIPVITSPNSGTNYTTSSNAAVTISGTCDASSTAIHVNGSASGVTYTPGNTTWSYLSSTLSSGANAFSVTALDGVGESAADTITITVVPPSVLSIVRASANPASASSVSFTVTFNSAVTGVDVNDFALTTTGVGGASVSAVSADSGATRTVTVNTGSGDGTIRLDVVDNDTIVDGISTPLGGAGAGNGNYTSGEVYTVQKFAANTVRQFGGSGNEAGQSIVLDASGNIYTTGYFDSTVDFDPGAGTANLTPAGGNDIYVSKLNGGGTLVWAKQLAGTGNKQGNGVAVDTGGNVYITGGFQGTVDFDPGAGTANLTAVWSWDTFVCKLDSSGNFVWVKQISGGADEIATSLALDTSGNVYITGFFSGTVDFDPGAGTANLTVVGNDDIFVCKLDSAGAFVWVKQMGGSGNESATAIAVDAGGNIYTTGKFDGTVDFDPGAGTANLTPVANMDVFVSKLNSSGAFVWAKQMGGNDLDHGYSIAVDSSGNVYTTGRFSTTADFDPGAGTANLTVAGSIDIFISKLDSTGAYVWAKGMGSVNFDEGTAVGVDANGNVYTAASFSGTIDTDPGAGTVNLTPGGTLDILISKLDSAGAFVWSKQMLGTGASAARANGLALDAEANAYTTGYFSGTVDFDPGPTTANLTAVGGNDIFVSKVSGTPPSVVSVLRADSNPTNLASVNYTVTFDRTVTGVDTTDFTLTTTGVTGAFVSGVSGSGSAYTVTVNTGSGDGTLRLNVSDNDSIVDAQSDPLGGSGAGNGNFAAGEVYDIDKTQPSRVISSTSPYDTNVSPIPMTVTFSEPVFGLVVGDIVATNGTIGNFAGSGDTYTFDLTPSGQGIVSANLVVGACIDAAGNVNIGGGALGRNYDTIGPTVAMTSGAGSPTGTSPITVTATFNEPVTGFTSGDITASNATVNNFAGSGDTYTFDLSPTGQGTVTADIAGGVCADAATNPNSAATQFTRVFDSIAPTVVLTSAASDPTNGSPIAVTASFSEPVTGFTAGDIAATNGSVSGFAGSGDTYTFNLTPSGQGSVTANVAGGVCTDAAGNGNSVAAQFSRVYDSVSPDVTLSTTASDPTSTSPIPVTVTFTEPVSGFDAGDIVLGNGTVNNFAGSGDTYTFDLVPSSNAAVTADVAGGVCADDAGNPNTVATQLTRDYDNVDPTVSITTTASDPTNTSPIPVTVTFSKNVTGFTSSDITLTNANKNSFTPVTQKVYTFNLVPTAQGNIGADIAAAVCTSTAGRPNQTGSFSITYDTVSPNVTLASTAGDPTNATPIPVTAIFDEPVTGFDAGDIVVANATVANFAGSGDTYSFDLVPSGTGNVTADVAGGVCTDNAGNPNTVSTQLSRTYDNVEPTVSITTTATDPANTSPIPVTVTFSKNVNGFVVGDITVTNGSKSNFVAVTQKIYTFDLTPTAQGSVSVDVLAGVATSNAGNPNQSGSFSITFDSVGPNVTLATTATNPTKFSPIPVTVTFDETVADFVSTDIVALNGTVANFTGSGTNYSFDLVPSGAGLVSANVAAGEAHDAAGNASNVSNTVSVTYDNLPPVILVTGSNPVQVDQFTAYADAGATASDNTDGDITANIVADTSNVNSNIVGFYTVTYDVTDAAGNDAVQATRTVEVVANATSLPVNPWLLVVSIALSALVVFKSLMRRNRLH